MFSYPPDEPDPSVITFHKAAEDKALQKNGGTLFTQDTPQIPAGPFLYRHIGSGQITLQQHNNTDDKPDDPDDHAQGSENRVHRSSHRSFTTDS